MASIYAKYKLYKKQQRPAGSQDNWVDCYPTVYSISGDTGQNPVIVEDPSAYCGYVPGGEMYRYVPDGTNTICEECEAASGYTFTFSNGETSISSSVTSGSSSFSVGVISMYYTQQTGYTVSSSTEWLSASTSSTGVSVTVNSNSGDTRSGQLTLTQDGSKYICTLGVSQADGRVYVFQLQNGSSSLTSSVTSGSSTLDIGVTSTYGGAFTGFSVSESLDWLSVTTSSTGISISVSANTGTVRNGTITLTQSGSNKTCTVVVTQEASMASQYLTFETVEEAATTINYQFNQLTLASADGGQTWVSVPKNRFSANYVSGRTIMVRKAVETVISTSAGTFSVLCQANSHGGTGITKGVKVYGNPLSLIYDELTGSTALGANMFNRLFYGRECDIYDASEMYLSTALTSYCYAFMFYQCYVNVSPRLSAMTLADHCYYAMFYQCSGLTTAPDLPATTLAESCYAGMFRDCKSLTTASVLPATTLANSCYYNMFAGCTSLTTAPSLSATTLAASGCCGMFQGCTALTTAPSVLPATTLANNCYDGMFSGCTSLTTAPSLPATTLAYGCYYYMFAGCASLTTAPELPAMTLAERCYEGMFYDCMALTTAPVLSAATLAYNCYDGMFASCPSLHYLKCLATDISAGGTDYWLDSTSTGTFAKAQGMNDWDSCGCIPSGWVIVDAT